MFSAEHELLRLYHGTVKLGTINLRQPGADHFGSEVRRYRATEHGIFNSDFMSNDRSPRDESRFEPVEKFLQNEALSRFSAGIVPTHLFDWQSLAEELEGTSNLSEQQSEDYRRRRIMSGSWKKSSTGESGRYQRRREKMVAALWKQLSRFYERDGYEALWALADSLEKREEVEVQKIDNERQRREYLNLLKGILLKQKPDDEETDLVEVSRQNPISTEQAQWVRSDGRPGNVGIAIEELAFEEKAFSKGTVPHPWVIGQEKTWREAHNKLLRSISQRKERILERGDLLQLIRLRLQLLKQKLWLIDTGADHEAPPEPYRVPEEVRGKQKAIQYCLMALSVMAEIEEPEDPKNWPSNSELAGMLKEKYDFTRLPLKPDSAVSRAASFLNGRSEGYQNFRPDFYYRLKIEADFLQYVADELEVSLPPGPSTETEQENGSR